MTLLEIILKKRIDSEPANQSAKLAKLAELAAPISNQSNPTVANKLTKLPKDTSVSNVSAIRGVNEKNSSVTFVDFVDAVQKINESVETRRNILLIQEFLRQTGGPIGDWSLILNKCKTDADAMRYFLSHSRGEFL